MKTYVIEFLDPSVERPQKAIQATDYAVREGIAEFYEDEQLIASIPAHVVLIERVRE